MVCCSSYFSPIILRNRGRKNNSTKKVSTITKIARLFIKDILLAVIVVRSTALENPVIEATSNHIKATNIPKPPIGANERMVISSNLINDVK